MQAVAHRLARETARGPQGGSPADDAPYAYLIYPHKPIVAYVPKTGRRQAELVRAFEEIPRDTDRVIFFPRAAGGAE